MDRSTIVQVSTVVVALNATSGVIGIGVESIQMGANTLGWCKVLSGSGSSLEDLVLDRFRLTLDVVRLANFSRESIMILHETILSDSVAVQGGIL